jgi:hypothetical protein
MTRAGHTRITQAALRHTLETITAHAFGVPPTLVSAKLDDDSGRLGVSVSVPLALPSLLAPGTAADRSIFDRSREARSAIINGGLAITGMTLGRVDIRLVGTKHSAPASRVDATQKQRQERRAQ